MYETTLLLGSQPTLRFCLATVSVAQCGKMQSARQCQRRFPATAAVTLSLGQQQPSALRRLATKPTLELLKAYALVLIAVSSR